MKVAIFSESSADEAALRVLVDAMRGQPTEPVGLIGLRTRGWPSVLGTLPAVIKQLHYHTDAEALAVVVDSDDSPVHQPSHDPTDAAQRGCRFCQLSSVVTLEQSRLTTVAGRSMLKFAVGLAVPAFEAWLLAGLHVHVTETAWTRSLQSKQRPYTRRELKQLAYGAEPVPLAVETARMVEHAQRLASDMTPLETHFPIGFGAFAHSVREW